MRTILKFHGTEEDLRKLIAQLNIHGIGEFLPKRYHFESTSGALMTLWYGRSRMTFGGPQREARKLRELFRPHLISVRMKRKRKPRQRRSAVVLPFKRVNSDCQS